MRSTSAIVLAFALTMSWACRGGRAPDAANHGPDETWAARRMQESKDLIHEYMVRKADALTERARQEMGAKAVWDGVKEQRHRELREMLGLLPWPERTPLRVEITGVIDQGAYSVEKIAFQSLPQFYVTGNLYVPKASRGPLPAIVYVCGHQDDRYGGKVVYQHHGISLAKNGYVAFVLDPIQNSEVFSVHAGIRAEEMLDWYSRGFTPGGVEAWNAMRAIDYLASRPEVDASRIGMTGFSGGAHMTFFTAAVDSRIKAAAAFMGISTYSANIRGDLQQVHCDCMYPINSYRHDLTHLGALIAPRPLLVGQGKMDGSFPRLGYERFRQDVGRLYSAYDQRQAFDLIEIDAPHEDADYFREQAIRWFDRHLMGVMERPLDLSYSALPGKDLAVFPNGPPKDAQNFRVHETFVARPAMKKFSDLQSWKRRRGELLASLGNHVFATLPRELHDVRIEDAPDPGVLPRWFHKEVRLSSRDTVPVRAMLRESATPNDLKPGILYVASDGDDAPFLHLLLWGVKAPNTWPAVVVFPRGIGELAWNKTPAKNMLRNAMVIGETTDSMRLVDVLLGLEVLARQQGVDPDRVIVLGKGVSGVLGAYAAILDERIREVILIDPPATHAHAPIFMNILRHTDLPETLALIAPRRLSFYRRLPKEYEHTRHVFELYGKPDQFSEIAWVEPK